MNTIIIGCRTLEDELNEACQQVGTDYPVVWVESGLHNVPSRLTKRLQEILDDVRADRVLLAMGFCGNSLIGLKTGDYETIVPRVDDCISLLLGGVKPRMELSKEMSAYFFTEGWLRGERNIWVEYQYSVKKYGKETADTIMKMMYGHYSTLALLDSGIYPIEKLKDETEMIAKTLNLQQKCVPATLDYLKTLLTGPWSKNRFLTLSPNTTIHGSDLWLNYMNNKLQI